MSRSVRERIISNLIARGFPDISDWLSWTSSVHAINGPRNLRDPESRTSRRSSSPTFVRGERGVEVGAESQSLGSDCKLSLARRQATRTSIPPREEQIHLFPRTSRGPGCTASTQSPESESRFSSYSWLPFVPDEKSVVSALRRCLAGEANARTTGISWPFRNASPTRTWSSTAFVVPIGGNGPTQSSPLQTRLPARCPPRHGYDFLGCVEGHDCANGKTLVRADGCRESAVLAHSL